MRSPLFRILTALAAIAALAAGVLTSTFAFVVLALLALFLLATSFSRASGLTEPLQGFRHQKVHVRVWGAVLPRSDGAPLTLQSVMAIGVGLRLYLQAGDGGRGTPLKIAQPDRARWQSDTVIIEDARYVQWAGERLPPTRGVPAVIISLRPLAGGEHRVSPPGTGIPPVPQGGRCG